MKTTFTTAAAVGALGLFSTALAGGYQRGEDFVFRYDTRELATQTGTEREYARLNRDIRHYCADNGSRGLAAARVVERCRAEILTTCEAQMPRTLLAFHLAETERRA